MDRTAKKRKFLNLNLLKDEGKKLKSNKSRTPKGKKSAAPKTSDGQENADKVDVEFMDKTVLIEDFNEGEDVLSDDIFVRQFMHELKPSLLTAVSSKPPQTSKQISTWPTLGKIIFTKPQVPEDEFSDRRNLLETTSYAEARALPAYSEQNFSLQKLCIKSQILENIKKANQIQNIDKLTPLQTEIMTLACNYHDIYFPEMSFTNMDELRLSYCAHVVNHVLKSRLKIIHHNAKLSKKDEVPEEFRDQGLVRPKVLILLPLRDTALRVVKIIINILLGEGGHVMNKNRFIEEFSGDTIKMPQTNPRPADYQALFSGNTDDNFKIGLSVTKKCLKLYSDFYTSDIIIASPLALRMLIGSEGERTRQFDFLASIEVLVMDLAHVMVMQNWEHVLHVINHLHLQPKDSHGTDLSRVRMWALNGCSRYYMQSMVFSFNPMPEITALFNSKFANFAGKVTIVNPLTSGSMSQVALQVPQVFHHVKSATVTQAVDDRFETFISDVLPQYKDPSMKHTLIYVPSYFDFVRLRNYLKKQEFKFVHVCEYTEEKKIIRARNKIFHGETQLLLYTERFHFYRRLKLRGIQNIIFYQPPAFPNFYSELCNFLQDVNKIRNVESEGEAIMTVNVLYTKFDVTQIAAIVGTDRATRMLASDKPTHMFMTDT
uniref:U3 small nucleolar RNA-associated protein 25 homolog n=1 Tax=Lygus hesperus TaxID=30085 RepID=A0A0K8SP75_LYGHE